MCSDGLIEAQDVDIDINILVPSDLKKEVFTERGPRSDIVAVAVKKKGEGLYLACAVTHEGSEFIVEDEEADTIIEVDEDNYPFFCLV